MTTNNEESNYACVSAIMPKVTWSMTLGNFYIHHTTKYSAWRAFWLRFMGWKVEKVNDNSTS